VFSLSLARRKRGSFASLVVLQEAINRFVEEHNLDTEAVRLDGRPGRYRREGPTGYHVLASMEREAG
jgi:hypothetical protein